ncbi:MAG: heavy metal translocating P-type ATPase, partial [Pedobacter sp.]
MIISIFGVYKMGMLRENSVLTQQLCFHCGEEMDAAFFISDDKKFCCTGCRTVYELLAKHNLSNYYAYNDVPGQTQRNTVRHFEYLEVKEIATQLVDYEDDSRAIVSLYIPAIHCSSCIWLLENLHQLQPAVL